MVEEQEHPGESKDGTGFGDHNAAYEFGHPRACLDMICQSRLTRMRSDIIDHTGAIEGDSDWVVPTPSGLFVPAPPLSSLWHDDVEQP